jgi:hypothetical protein
MERYNVLYQKKTVQPANFEFDRFFSPQAGETNYQTLEGRRHYVGLKERYPSATYIGDKFPGIYLAYQHLVTNFPGARFIFIVRNVFDVAISFEGRRAKGTNWPKNRGAKEAVAAWNTSLRQTAKWMQQAPILTVCYEDLFVRSQPASRIAEFLELDAGPFDQALARERANKHRESSATARLPPDDAEYICRNAIFGIYRRLLGTIEEHDATAASVAA